MVARKGNVVDPMGQPPSCECGCGRTVPRRKNGKGYNRYSNHACAERAAKGRNKKRRLAEKQRMMASGVAPVCECGCGQQVNWNWSHRKWSKYVYGHYAPGYTPSCDNDAQLKRLLSTYPDFMDWEVIEKRCHEMKHRLSTRGISPGRYRAIRYCACECGGRLPPTSVSARKYLPGHLAIVQERRTMQGRIERHGPAPFCACGCNQKVTYSKRRQQWNKYLPNHCFRDPDWWAQFQVAEYKEKQRERSLKELDNREYWRAWARGLHARPNNFERAFDLLTDDAVRYTGDGSFVVRLTDGRRKNPDFVIGKDKVVELHGDYWHKGEDADELIGLYREVGYECLVIWEHEMEDISAVLEKVSAFIGRQTWQLGLAFP